MSFRQIQVFMSVVIIFVSMVTAGCASAHKVKARQNMRDKKSWTIIGRNLDVCNPLTAECSGIVKNELLRTAAEKCRSEVVVAVECEPTRRRGETSCEIECGNGPEHSAVTDAKSQTEVTMTEEEREKARAHSEKKLGVRIGGILLSTLGIATIVAGASSYDRDCSRDGNESKDQCNNKENRKKREKNNHQAQQISGIGAALTTGGVLMITVGPTLVGAPSEMSSGYFVGGSWNF
jgi:hypothetical protein